MDVSVDRMRQRRDVRRAVVKSGCLTPRLTAPLQKEIAWSRLRASAQPIRPDNAARKVRGPEQTKSARLAARLRRNSWTLVTV